MASNQLSARELEELIKLYKQIDGLTQAAAESEALHAQSIGNARQQLERLRKEYTDLTSDISSALTAFQRIVQEITNQNKGIRESTKAYNKLTSIAEKIQYHQRDISKLSAKEIVNLKSQIEKEKQRLENAQTLLKDKKAQFETEKSSLETEIRNLGIAIRNRQANGQNSQQEIRAIIRKQRELEKVKDSLNRTQITLNENKAILEDQSQAYGGLVATAEELNKQLGFMGRLAGKLGNIPGIGESLSGAAESFNKWGKGAFIVNEIIKGFNSLNKAQVEFGRETGKNIAHMDTLNMTLISSSDYIKTATALSKQFGANADAIFTKETLQEATEMVNLMGMASEDAGKLARFTKLSGVDLKASNINVGKQLESFNKTNRTGISLSSIFRDVAKTSDDIAMSLGGNPSKIALANAEARKLGLSLDQVNKIAGSLLQFEDSISAELEAELLTGKQINLEQARLYALNNDIVGLTKEIGTNQDLINSFAGSNRIQQEAIAKSLGLGREEMAKMIYDQRAINGLNDEQLQKVMGVGSEELKRLSVQESINKSIEKITEAMAGPLEMLAQTLFVGEKLKIVFGLIATIIATRLVVGLADMGRSLITAIPRLATILGLESGIAAAKISGAMAFGVGLGAVAILGAIAMGTKALSGSIESAKSMKDGEINKQGKPTLFTGRGMVKIEPDDQIYAAKDGSMKVGTDLLGENQSLGVKPTNTNTAIKESTNQLEFDYDKMAAAMAKLKININTAVQIDKKEISNITNEVQLTTAVKTQ